MDRKIKEAAGAYRVHSAENNQVQDFEQFYGLSENELHTKLALLLRRFGYAYSDTSNDFHQHSRLGLLFTSLIESRPAIFIDCSKHEISSDTFEYVDYTTHQNYLMHKHSGVLIISVIIFFATSVKSTS